jgi:putative transposase
MARPLRLEFPGALYHLTARGNAGGEIFADDADRACFLDLLGKEIAQQRWRCYAYCLMGNHYHLLIETPEPNLVTGMRRLNGVYTQGFNRRHGRAGHVFQGRYKSILVDKDSYALELTRYIALNPVRARLAKQAGDWRWSSYRATAGQEPAPSWLAVDWVLEQFGTRGPRRAYQQFVQHGLGQSSPWEHLRGQIWLGDQAFLDRMQALSARQPSENVTRAQRTPTRPSADAITAMVLSAYRIKDEKALRSRESQQAFQAWVYLLRRAGNEALRDVAQRCKVSASRISKIQRTIETSTPAPTLRMLQEKCKLVS